MENAPAKIIVADDSESTVKYLETILAKQGYNVHTAFNGKRCIELVEEINPDLIITDIYMPLINGIDICKTLKLNKNTSHIPIMILTSSELKDDHKEALQYGANDYLKKDVEVFELKLKVESLIKLKKTLDQLEDMENIILSLAKAVEVKDKYTEGHATRVSLYALKIGKSIGLSEKQTEDLSFAGILHDVGKIGIPDNILNKPGKLTNKEYEVIKQHPLTGEEICTPIKSFSRICRIIRHHHEKLNGSGYPDGLTGNDLDIETRIMTVADIYDALTSNRAYRPSMDNKTAFEILFDSANNGELDIEIVKTFEKIIAGRSS